MNKEHFSKLERMYLSANINTQIYDTTTIRIMEETADIGLTTSAMYFHALGAIHGSVYFKLLDDAAFFAVNSIVTDCFVLTTSFNIQLFRPAIQGKIKSVGKVIFKSKKIFTAESRLYNEQEKEIGMGVGNFAKSKVALSRVLGYK